MGSRGPNIGTNTTVYCRCSSSAATANSSNNSSLQHIGGKHAQQRQKRLTVVLATSNPACCLQVDLIVWTDPLPLGGRGEGGGAAAWGGHLPAMRRQSQVAYCLFWLQ